MTGKNTIYIFMGPPGAGKGSLSSLCTQKLGWNKLSTGDLCRQHIAQKTEIGKAIDFALKSGKLVSDRLITSMVSDWLREKATEAQPMILDGYPRTVDQAKALDILLKEQFRGLDVSVVRLTLSDEDIVARLKGRFVCSNRKCQAVYSILPGSSLLPIQERQCDACSSLLIRREDDTESTIRERLKTYHIHEEKLLTLYADLGYMIYECSTALPIDEVFVQFKALLGLKTA